MTNWIAARFLGGEVYFVGLSLSLLAAAIRFRLKSPRALSVAAMTALIGVVFVVFSATPFPFWGYGAWLVILLLALAAPSRKNPFRRIPLILLLFITISLAVIEFPYHLPQAIHISDRDAIFVIGDSLSMGADPPAKNWPELLGDSIEKPVTNLSFGGAMLDTALHNADKIEGRNLLIILEIGGNDLLKGRRDFETNLEVLLDSICMPERHVVMIELPLPPFFNRYGTAQRRLAKQYDVTLIPKRYLAGALAAPGATSDGLHFSNIGHALFAKKIEPFFIK